MVESVIRTVRPSLPVTLVHASRGKITRAEPVSALWEQARGHLVGVMPELEEELTGFAPGLMEHSPDRADALVWAVSSLMEVAGPEKLLAFYRQEADRVKARSAAPIPSGDAPAGEGAGPDAAYAAKWRR